MPTLVDRALVDADVLVYALLPEAPLHVASRAPGASRDRRGRLCISLTVVSEFLSVVTDARRVTPARSPEEATQAIEAILALPGMTLLSVPSDVVERLIGLVRTHRVKGSSLFDFQIMATMLGNGLTRVYPYNRPDFEQVPEIEVLTP